MKKALILKFFIIVMLAWPAGLQAQSGTPDSGGAYRYKIPPATLKALLAAPAATGKSAFELGAGEFNRWLDKQMPELPKSQRPYLDAPTLARMCDSMLKSYRAGDRVLAEEILSRIPVDLSLEEKVDFLETITRAYLASAAKKK